MNWLTTVEHHIPLGTLRARMAAVPVVGLLAVLLASATLGGPWAYTWRIWGMVLVAVLAGAAAAWALAAPRRPSTSPSTVTARPGAVRLDLVSTLVDLIDQLPNETQRHHVRRTLDDAGVIEYQADGQHFDPALHEAIDVEWTDDPSRERLVARTLRSGFRLGSDVVRVADVLVYRTAPAPSDDARQR